MLLGNSLGESNYDIVHQSLRRLSKSLMRNIFAEGLKKRTLSMHIKIPTMNQMVTNQAAMIIVSKINFVFQQELKISTTNSLQTKLSKNC